MILAFSIAGGCLFFFLFTFLSDFISSHIQNDMESQAKAIYNIGDQYLNELFHKGRSSNRIAIRIAKAKTRGVIDDLMREKQLMGIMMTEGQEIHRSENLPENITADNFLDTPENQVIEWNKESMRYYLYHFQFDPWQWHIILVKDSETYTFLVKKVKTVSIIIIFILGLVTFLLLLYLRKNTELYTKKRLAIISLNKTTC